ncbi:MAG TPA: ATP-binding protein [Hyphomonadaceae bacterium]|nr:ATP-binding protein [Hyphomonadaceae bacterium]
MPRINLILKTAIISAVIIAIVVPTDMTINLVLLPGDSPYTPLVSFFITLAVSPAVIGFLVFQADKIQRQQADLAKERAARLAETEAALKLAEAATRSKSEVLANVSHEIRTPLNGVLGMAQALEAQTLDAESREMVATIRDSGVTLMAILNDVLDLSKIEAGKMDVSPVDGHVLHTLSHVHKLFLPRAGEKGLRLTLESDPALADRLSYDPVRVRQCVSNLVSNAVKFTREGSVRVHVSTAPAPGSDNDGRTCVTVRVTDTGIGMDEAASNRLFAAFTQADASTTRQFGGTGLGLTISRNLARLMGGDIVVRSEPGAGSEFELTFLADPANAAIAQGPSDQQDEARRPARLRGARLLLADDNAINRQVARLFLQPQGVVITEAANGQEALDKLAAAEFDLVLLDVHMPVMDGIQAIRAIRSSDQPWSTLPVIALTADAMSGDRERFIAMGMSGYVSKPIDRAELLTEIGRVLGVGPVGVSKLESVTADASESFDDMLGELDRIAKA